MSKRQRIIFIIAVVVCTIAGTLFISRNKHLAMYEASASIYPMQMRCDGGSKATINPSYKYKRILASEEFNNSLPALPAGVQAPVERVEGLCAWKFHESNDHQIHVSLYMKDSNEAVEMLTRMVELANEMYENCNSTQLEKEGSCHEAVVADYQKLVAETNLPAGGPKLQWSLGRALQSPHLLCCDITSSPQIVRVPSVGSIVFYTILNFLFSLIVCGAAALIYKRSRNDAT